MSSAAVSGLRALSKPLLCYHPSCLLKSDRSSSASARTITVALIQYMLVQSPRCKLILHSFLIRSFCQFCTPGLVSLVSLLVPPRSLLTFPTANMRVDLLLVLGVLGANGAVIRSVTTTAPRTDGKCGVKYSWAACPTGSCCSQAGHVFC